MGLTWAEKVKKILQSIWFLWSLVLILNIITFLFVFFKIHPGNKTLALHYNVLVGVQWYGRGKNLYWIPGVGLMISAINFWLYRYFRHNETFLAYNAAFVSICVQVTLLAACLFLATVN